MTILGGILVTIIAHGGDPENALQQQREFYELMGRAISQWAYLEDQVYHTYRKIINPGDLVAAATAYHSILNMNTRLDMIDAGLAVSKKYKSHLPEWEKLRKKIRKKSAHRAKLAHWTVVQDAGQPNELGVTMYLQPPTYDFGSYNDDGEREKLHAKQVVDFASPHYSRLAADLSEASGIGRVDGGFRGGFSLRVGD